MIQVQFQTLQQSPSSTFFHICKKIRFKLETPFLADPGAEIQPGLNLLGPIKQKFLMVRS
jgi:hypothetical protein